MKERKLTTELQKQLNKLIDEQKSSEKYLEDYKNKVSEEIKRLNINQVKNTPKKHYSLWQRIMMVLWGN